MDTVESGKRIKNRRLELNLTQSDIKQKTGISTGNLSDIERGRSAPSASALCELSDVLECSVDYILLGNLGIPINQNYRISVNSLLQFKSWFFHPCWNWIRLTRKKFSILSK